MPTGAPAAARVVTIATPVANRPITSRKSRFEKLACAPLEIASTIAFFLFTRGIANTRFRRASTAGEEYRYRNIFAK